MTTQAKALAEYILMVLFVLSLKRVLASFYDCWAVKCSTTMGGGGFLREEPREAVIDERENGRFLLALDIISAAKENLSAEKSKNKSFKLGKPTIKCHALFLFLSSRQNQHVYSMAFLSC